MTDLSGARFVVWGSAGHALVLQGLLKMSGASIVVVVDNDPAAVPVVHGVPLVHGQGGLEDFLRTESQRPLHGAVAIGGGRGHARRDILTLLGALGLAAPTLVHPKSAVCDTAQIGPGSQILANATVAAAVSIAHACIVNHGAIVDHECRLGAGTHVAPGATLCGCVTVGENVFIGAGAVVLPRLRLGAGCVVGAGAVVTSDVREGAVVVGNPARPLSGR